MHFRKVKGFFWWMFWRFRELGKSSGYLREPSSNLWNFRENRTIYKKVRQVPKKKLKRSISSKFKVQSCKNRYPLKSIQQTSEEFKDFSWKSDNNIITTIHECIQVMGRINASKKFNKLSRSTASFKKNFQKVQRFYWIFR